VTYQYVCPVRVTKKNKSEVQFPTDCLHQAHQNLQTRLLLPFSFNLTPLFFLVLTLFVFWAQRSLYFPPITIETRYCISARAILWKQSSLSRINKRLRWGRGRIAGNGRSGRRQRSRVRELWKAAGALILITLSKCICAPGSKHLYQTWPQGKEIL